MATFLSEKFIFDVVETIMDPTNLQLINLMILLQLAATYPQPEQFQTQKKDLQIM
jgi:hypothetical protein